MSRIVPSPVQEEAAKATLWRLSEARTGAHATQAASGSRTGGRASAAAADAQPAHVVALRIADNTEKRPGASGPGDPNVQGNYRALVDEVRVEAPGSAKSEAATSKAAEGDAGPVMERIRVQQVLRALDETERLSAQEQGPPSLSGEVLDTEDPMQGGAEIIDITPRDTGA